MNSWQKIFIGLVLIFFLLIPSCGKKNTSSRDVTSPFQKPKIEISKLETYVYGFNTFVAGSTGSLRIVVVQPEGLRPVGDVDVEITFISPQEKVKLFQGKTDKNGTVKPSFVIPAKEKGQARLEIRTSYKKFDKAFSYNVNITEPQTKVFLSTDKPYYQPRQMIKIRVLALTKVDLKPVVKKKFTLEIYDPKNNKVLKQDLETSLFGVASSNFKLADDIINGVYRLVVSDGQNATYTRMVTVKKYVLPKFKVAIEADKQFYLPGQTITGTVKSNYFFGKPVSEGKVILNFMSFDGNSYRSLGQVAGMTDREGTYKFVFSVPAGLGYQEGSGVQIEANIIDKANHKDSTTRRFPVVTSAVQIQLTSECQNLATNINNRIYVLTNYPDGSPAVTNLEVEIGQEKKQIKTNDIGFAELEYKPTVGENVLVKVKAEDKMGNKTEKQISLASSPSADNIILRTDKSIYNYGQPIKLEALSSYGEYDHSVYVDFIDQDSLTKLTTAFPLQKGQGTLTVNIPEDLKGTVLVKAYYVSPYGMMVSNSKLIFVHPSANLNVKVSMDKESYRPGNEAVLKFDVSDAKGNPVISALGISIVDESMFSLSGRTAGYELTYFLLDKTLISEKMAFKGFSMPDLIKENKEDKEQEKEKRQIFARLLLAQMTMQDTYNIQENTYQGSLNEIYQKFNSITSAVYSYQSKYNKLPASIDELVANQLLDKNYAQDPWGNKFVLEVIAKTPPPTTAPSINNERQNIKISFPRRPYRPYGPSYRSEMPFDIICIGADRKLGTFDDIRFQKLMVVMNVKLGGHYRDEEHKGLQRRPSVSVYKKETESTRRDLSYKSKEAPAPSMEKDQLKAPVTGKPTEQEPARLREYFPETLYFNPEIITDNYGRATLTIPMADSITTWQVYTLANTLNGGLGYRTDGLKVFQDFFIDLDLPVSLTQGDEVSIPVAVYNYLPNHQQVRVFIEKAGNNWFNVIGTQEHSLTLDKSEVKVVYFRIKVLRPGIQPIAVHGRGTVLSDSIKKTIEIVPNGKKFMVYKGGRLQKQAVNNVDIPNNAINDTSRISLVFYPGVLAQVVEGLDNIFKQPYGCCEQTISSTYPNVLVLNYLKKTNKISPKLTEKATEYINYGYQRLMTYEAQGNGFSSYGRSGGDSYLTTYALLLLSDMAKVHPVDPNVISRAQQWIISKQQQDGSFGGNIANTAYVVWVLSESGNKGEQVKRAVTYLKENLDKIGENNFMLVMCANALVSFDPADLTTRELLKKLHSKKIEQGNKVFWSAQRTHYSRGNLAHIETTCLAAYALLRANLYLSDVNKALTYITEAKDARGTWHSTSATILAMKVLVLSLEKASEKLSDQTQISVYLNGGMVKNFYLNAKDFDTFQQFDLKQYTKRGRNNLKLVVNGQGSCFYRIVGEYYLPWKRAAAKAGKEPKSLKLSVTYNKTKLAVNETIKCNIKVSNQREEVSDIVMVETGIAPGFKVVVEDLDKLVQTKKIEKYELFNNKVVLYLNKIEKDNPFNISYQLTAKYPIKAKPLPSVTYLYYNPEINDTDVPVTFVVM